MYFREVIFGDRLFLPHRRRHGNWIWLLSMAALAAIAWHYGILASGLRATGQISIAILNMLLGLTDSIRAFLKSVISHIV